MGVDDRAWDHSTFSKNRERLLEGDIAAKLLSAVMAQPLPKRRRSSPQSKTRPFFNSLLVPLLGGMRCNKADAGGVPMAEPAGLRNMGIREVPQPAPELKPYRLAR